MAEDTSDKNLDMTISRAQELKFCLERQYQNLGREVKEDLVDMAKDKASEHMKNDCSYMPQSLKMYFRRLYESQQDNLMESIEMLNNILGLAYLKREMRSS